MLVIGITGGSGAGKSTLMQALKATGALALDCDEIYHELLLCNEEMIAQIESRFKEVVVNGVIDRKKLGDAVWSNPSALSDLNQITHKYVIDEVNRRIISFNEQGGSVVAIDAIALIESGQSQRCDIVIGVTAPDENRIERIIKRDALTIQQAKMRITAQQPESFYKENCDYILENTCASPTEFLAQCNEFFKQKGIFDK